MMTERFPDIDWYCDRCHDYLNAQAGFDDHKYTWKCKKCGYKVSISKDSIIDSLDSFPVRLLGYILGFLRVASLYLFLALILKNTLLQISLFEILLQKYILYSGATYLGTSILSMLFERFIAKIRPKHSFIVWIISSFFYYIFIDITSPLKELWGMLRAIISFYKYKSVTFLLHKIFFAVVHICIVLVALIICLSNIII